MNYIKALFPQPNLLLGEIAWVFVFGLVYWKQGEVTTAIASASTAGLAVAHLTDTVQTATSK
jgi:hypothetical protein